MIKFFKNFDKNYEIYEVDRSEPWYRWINWYVILIATSVCVLNTTIAVMTNHISPFLGVFNLMMIMPLSPLAVLHIRKRDNGTDKTNT